MVFAIPVSQHIRRCQPHRHLLAVAFRGAVVNNLVQMPPVKRFFGRHEIVPLKCPLNGFQGLTGMFDIDLVDLVFDLLGFRGMDHDIRRLPLIAA